MTRTRGDCALPWAGVFWVAMLLGALVIAPGCAGPPQAVASPDNEAPRAFHSRLEIDEDQEVISYLHASDGDGDPLTYTFARLPRRGRVELLQGAAGQFRYRPDPHAHGADQFDFRAGDGEAESNSATVYIDIHSVNDPPRVRMVLPDGSIPLPEGESVMLAAEADDVDGTILGVEFFVDGVAVGARAQAPHQVPWTATLGSHVIAVAATDDMRAQSQASVRLRVTPGQRVPGQHGTIQAAIDAAQDGEVVLLAPGLYRESVRIAGKGVVLASHRVIAGDASLVEQTILEGGAIGIETAGGAARTQIVGLTVRGATTAVRAASDVELLGNHLRDNGTGLACGDGTAIVRGNVFAGHSQSAILLQGAATAIIEDNAIHDNPGGGIVVHLPDYFGPLREVAIRDNRMVGNGGHAVALVDHPGASQRLVKIERNLLADTALAAVASLAAGEPMTSMTGAALVEPVWVIGNTVAGNGAGVTGGDNMAVINNLFLGSRIAAVQRLRGASLAAYNLLWGNAVGFRDSNYDRLTTVSADPLVLPDYRLSPGSPAIDAGTAFYRHEKAVVVDLPPEAYARLAPDLGAFEYHPP